MLERDKKVIDQTRPLAGNNHPSTDQGKEKQEGIVLALETSHGVGRWIEQRMARHSSAKETLVLGFILFVAFVGGPALVFYYMSWILAGSLGTSGGGAAALAFNAFIYLLLIGLAGILGFLTLKIVFKPAHLLIDRQGLQYQYWTPLGHFKGRPMLWKNVDRIEIFKPRNRVNPGKFLLCFLNGAKKIFQLELGRLSDLESRETLGNAVETFLPGIQCDPEVAMYLEPPAGHSYTEIWFQSLTDTPDLQKLVPLPEQTLLKQGEYQILSHFSWPHDPGIYRAKCFQPGNNSAARTLAFEQVILKEALVPPGKHSGSAAELLEQRRSEVAALLAAKHPNIVHCLDAFVENNRFYLAFEEPKGEFLRTLVEKKGVLSERQTIHLICQLCDALLYLSMRKPPLIFATVSPDHVKFDAKDVPVLLDLKPLASSKVTGQKLSGGRPGYLPPEFLTGQILPQSNVYGLGATSFFLLTGVDPEPLSSSDPGLHRDGLSPQLRLLIAKATNPEPAQRHADYLAFKAALSHLSSQE